MIIRWWGTVIAVDHLVRSYTVTLILGVCRLTVMRITVIRILMHEGSL